MSLNTGNAILSNAITVDGSYNVGIGGAVDASYKLKVTGTTLTTGAATFSSSVTVGSGTTSLLSLAGTSFGQITSPSTLYYDIDTQIFRTTAGTERMRITSSGNVGIGTSNPLSKLHIKQSSGGYTGGIWVESNLNASELYIHYASAIDAFAIGATYETGGAYKPIAFFTSDVERMRITSGGDVLIGFTGGTYNDPIFNNVQGIALRGTTTGVSIIASSTGIPMFIGKKGTTGTMVEFEYNGTTTIGSITNTTTSVAYNTTSDYRLKEDLQDFNALNSISAIKVYDFKWKTSGERTTGVLAHELSEVLPYAVNGEKDAVKENGIIIPQGVDYSKIVPVLVKAIQEQQAMIEAQQQQINQLINK